MTETCSLAGQMHFKLHQLTGATSTTIEHIGPQLVLITTCLPGNQINTLMAGGLVAMVDAVNMVKRHRMHRTAPGHSILNMALMLTLDKGQAPELHFVTPHQRRVHMMIRGGAEMVRQQEIADRHYMQTGRLHTQKGLPPMLKGLHHTPKGPHPMLNGDHLMSKGHLMQTDQGPHNLSSQADLRSQLTGLCQQRNIFPLLTRPCSHPRHPL